MPLERVCLTVRLLTMDVLPSEYLQTTIVRPSYTNVYDAVKSLTEMDIFDELGAMTWLGIRLIDVPIDCQLGKLLVFAILLQCLDPILTIVSFLNTMDPMSLPSEVDEQFLPYIGIIRNKIKQERKRLSDGIFSDHLMFLRLYQEWQNNLRDDSPGEFVV